jgi:hypothetical protein
MIRKDGRLPIDRYSDEVYLEKAETTAYNLGREPVMPLVVSTKYGLTRPAKYSLIPNESDKGRA